MHEVPDLSLNSINSFFFFFNKPFKINIPNKGKVKISLGNKGVICLLHKQLNKVDYTCPGFLFIAVVAK